MIVDEEKVARKALNFAAKAHDWQKRKYTFEPYINHPIAVAKLVSEVTNNQSMIAAALLHDTVEDTWVTLDVIEREFGCYIAAWVEDLTDVSKPTDGNRAARKLIDLQHTAKALPPAKTIKLADLIDNTRSIVAHDPGFAVVYMNEKRQLLKVLKEGGDPILYARAKALVDDYFAEHNNEVTA